jgi:hypothetical protein
MRYLATVAGSPIVLDCVVFDCLRSGRLRSTVYSDSILNVNFILQISFCHCFVVLQRRGYVRERERMGNYRKQEKEEEDEK